MGSKITRFASESVCAGHPDKICDQISDAIVDEVLKVDPQGRVAVETLVCNDRVILAGEVSSLATVKFEKIARKVITDLGYVDSSWGFSDQSHIDCFIHQQSQEIALGVNNDGAGDQGMMFGFACNETSELMPLPITLAHQITRRIDECREKGILPHLRPDGKAQVVIRYEDDQPVAVEHVTIAVPHDEKISLDRVKEDIKSSVLQSILDEYGFFIHDKDLIVNGTGVWHQPGPASDAGLTGRKIVVDTYGGYARVGGGAFSGKDPSKVDRSGAYAARFIAKNIVSAGYATKAEVGLAYYIGAHKPVNFSIDTFGTSLKSQTFIEEFAHNLLDLSVKGIIEGLDLRRPIYKQTASYGHFGKANLPWEKITG
ncbi:MAG: methionine adenosyltransferase [Candidatus Saccharimonadales bacterium]